VNDWIRILGWTLAAGLAMPAGAALSLRGNLHPAWLERELRHAILAFGGGALLAAVALVLVPEGMDRLPLPAVAVAFLLGAGVFMGIDRFLARRRQPASQSIAMLTDFLPEALALGALMNYGTRAGPLLALIMILQNLPEGFNAGRELSAFAGIRRGRVLALFSGLALMGPFCGLAGYWWLGRHPSVVAGIMLFAAGGILYLVFQDIAPQARLERHWGPPLGAVAGFLLGMLGHALVGP